MSFNGTWRNSKWAAPQQRKDLRYAEEVAEKYVQNYWFNYTRVKNQKETIIGLNSAFTIKYTKLIFHFYCLILQNLIPYDLGRSFFSLYKAKRETLATLTTCK